MEHTGRYFHRQETVCGNFLLKKESVQTCQNGLYRVIQVIRPTAFRRARRLLLVSDKRSHVRRAMIEEECCYRPHAYVTLSIISGCFPRFSVPQVRHPVPDLLDDLDHSTVLFSPFTLFIFIYTLSVQSTRSPSNNMSWQGTAICFLPSLLAAWPTVRATAGMGARRICSGNGTSISFDPRRRAEHLE